MFSLGAWKKTFAFKIRVQIFRSDVKVSVTEREIWKTWLGWNAVALHPAWPLCHPAPQLFSPTIIHPALFFFPPITSTLTAYFCSPVVTNVAFSASLNRLTPKQATHSDTGSKTVHPCAALNPAQARHRRGKLRCVVTDQRLVSKFVQHRGSDVKMRFSTGPLFSACILEPNALTCRIVGWFTPRGVVALEG